MQRLILFLIRKRLGLRKGEFFRFTNQKNKSDWYYFTSEKLMKNTVQDSYAGYIDRESSVKLNWILSPKCKVEKVPYEEIFPCSGV